MERQTDQYTIQRMKAQRDPNASRWEDTAEYGPVETRMPQGLPLEPVYYGPLRVGEVGAGTQWPPIRLRNRIERMKDQALAARGDMKAWVRDKPSVTFCPPWFRSYVKTLRAILLRTEPGIGEPTRDALIQRAVGQCIRDMLVHGASAIIASGEEIISVAIERCFPVEDGSWIVVEEWISAESEEGRVDRMTVRELSTEGPMTVSTYAFDGAQLNDLVEAPTTQDASFGVAFMPDDDGVGWGQAPIDDLLQVLTVAALTYTDIRYCQASFGRPVAMTRITNADAAQIMSDAAVAKAVKPVDPNKDEVQEAIKYMMSRPFLNMEDGALEAKMLEWNNNITAAQAILDLCEIEFTKETGMPRMEAGDNANIQSGSSIERRYEMMVARAAEMHSALLDLLRTVVGPEVEWPLPVAKNEEAIDDDDDSDNDPNSPNQPAPDDEEERR